MAKDTALKFLGAHPPEFSTDEACAILEMHYGINGEMENLWGERDQNFKVGVTADQGYVLKISNKLEEVTNIDSQIKAMEHLSGHAPNLVIPEVISLLYGKKQEQTDQAIRYTSLYPLTAKCVSIGIYDIDKNKSFVYYESEKAEEWFSEDQQIHYKGLTEVEILKSFWKINLTGIPIIPVNEPQVLRVKAHSQTESPQGLALTSFKVRLGFIAVAKPSHQD